MTLKERAENLWASLHGGAGHDLQYEEIISRIALAFIEERKIAFKDEREAIIKPAEERRAVIQDYIQDLDRDTMNYKIATIQISELDHMISMICARSEG